MTCLRPKQILNPRYKEGGYKKRLIYCREYGLDNCVTMRDPESGLFLLFPPDYWITIPCGRCSECLKSRLRGWSIRLLKEIRCHPCSTFLTLTLDPLNLERFKDDPKKPLKLYVDRLRKALGFRPRYYFISELGEERDRLHFHGIIFGTDRKTLSYAIQRKKWKYGHVWLGYANDRTANYIVKYITKDKDNYKPFILCSNGIGSSYVSDKTIEKHINGFDPIMYISHNGAKYPIPPYYRNKLFNEDVKMCILLNRLNDTTSFERRFHGFTFTDELSYQRALSSFASWSENQNLGLKEDVKLNSLFDYNPYKFNELWHNMYSQRLSLPILNEVAETSPCLNTLQQVLEL